MMSVEQVAEKWNLSTRTVQNFCKTGRIPGAVTIGKIWMIPDDAERPRDGRYKGSKAAANTQPKIKMPVQSPLMILSTFYGKPGTAEKCVASLSATPETQALFAGEMAFIQGDIPKAREIVRSLLQTDADFYGALNVGMIASALSVWENDKTLWKKGRERMAAAPCTNDGQREIRDLWLEITDSVIPAKRQDLNASWTHFYKLPEDSMPIYLFYYAKYLHRLGVEVAREEAAFPDIQGMGVLRMIPYLAEPLIAQVHSAGAVLAEIYLRLLCADAYNKIGETETSQRHLDMAISLCLPDKLYGVLAEYRGLMSNTLDVCLERKDPEAAKKVKNLEREMYANWMKMNNQSADMGLSDRQKEIARLASVGLSNKEIAECLHISYHTVKSTITMIMNKTGTSKRSEFSSYRF